MSTQTTYLEGDAARSSSYAEPQGAGWVIFAAIMLTFAGVFNFFDGILAIAGSRVYGVNTVYVFSDLNTWGWIVTVLAVVQMCAAFSLYSGSQFGRWFGIAAASVNAIAQLMFVSAYPVWALAVFAVDVLVIYGLAVYGGQKMPDA